MQPPIRVSAPIERLAASGLASAATSTQIPPDEPARARHPPTALWCSLAFIVLLCLIALFAPLLAPYSPNEQLGIVGLKTRPPSFAHPLGTDQYSRDLVSRLLFGARISLSVAMLAVLLSATVGTAYGLVAGYLGGRVDAIMMRLLDACLSIPRVLLLVALLALWSPVPLGALIAIIGFTGWFEVSRLVGGGVVLVLQREFALAPLALGTPGPRVGFRYRLHLGLAPGHLAETF